MEAFINRWLWLMSLNDIRKLKESIAKQTALMAAATASSSSSSSAATSTNRNASESSSSQTASKSSAEKTSVTRDG